MIALLATPAVAAGYQAGDWVLGNFRGGQFWFPGIVQATTGGKIVVQYDDGDREVLPPALVRPYSWRVGTHVECNWLGRGAWYGGTITRLDAGSIAIAYDDGDTEATTTGRCRSR